MRGHLPLVAMRRRGLLPTSVFILADGCEDTLRQWSDWHQFEPRIPHVEIDPRTDSPARLDLRFLRGVPLVHVWTDGEHREHGIALMHACVDHGVGRVFGAVLHDVNDPSLTETFDTRVSA